MRDVRPSRLNDPKPFVLELGSIISTPLVIPGQFSKPGKEMQARTKRTVVFCFAGQIEIWLCMGWRYKWFQDAPLVQHHL